MIVLVLLFLCGVDPPGGGYALNGPYERWQSPCYRCLVADYDFDGDVDLFDFGEMLNDRAYTGGYWVCFTPRFMSWRSFSVCAYGPSRNFGELSPAMLLSRFRGGLMTLRDFSVLTNGPEARGDE